MNKNNEEIKKQIFKSVREIEIKTNKLVNTLIYGNFQSVFLGNGIDFMDLREYIPGDDIRFIDWKSSARKDEIFIKKYNEERESVYCFILDYSKSMFFRKKLEFSLLLLSGMMMYAAKNNNTFYVFTLSNKLNFLGRFKQIKDVYFVTELIVDDILENSQEILKSKKFELKDALKKISFRNYTHTIIISDFFFENFEKELNYLKTIDFLALQVISNIELNPKTGIYELDGIRILTENKRFKETIANKQKEIKRIFLKKGYKFFTLDCENDLFQEIKKILIKVS
ncbi:MAG: DUF58 domain-containing protein [Candidatus Woesearchaeota archaeon]